MLPAPLLGAQRQGSCQSRPAQATLVKSQLLAVAERGDGNKDAEDDTQPLVSGETSSGNEAPEPSKPSWVPHRWRVVIMMALAFVLCNMDKVLACSRCRHTEEPPLCVTGEARALCRGQMVSDT